MAGDELPDDVPEADALEQRRAVDDQPDADADAVLDDDSFEVPEADALDQARAVPTDDEPDPEG
ncbi:MAG TPA: hypothetical protein VLR27_00565 [Acidimicrobiales bacterium]|nr:hypothetical protein [Acidimicrobiales bacterium]